MTPLSVPQLHRVRAYIASALPPGMRERLLGDPGFPVKLSIEVGIGVTMKLLAEISKRGDNFSSELDLVFANVVMAIIADTMLVWLPAPRAATSSQKAPINQTAIGKWLKSCPDNAFQVSDHTTSLRWSNVALQMAWTATRMVKPAYDISDAQMMMYSYSMSCCKGLISSAVGCCRHVRCTCLRWGELRCSCKCCSLFGGYMSVCAAVETSTIIHCVMLIGCPSWTEWLQLGTKGWCCPTERRQTVRSWVWLFPVWSGSNKRNHRCQANDRPRLPATQ